MDAPMMLPWMARKWDVSDARALALWRQACQEADVITGSPSSPRYWAYAKSRWVDLLDNDVIARYPALATPWIMMQLNVLRVLAWVRSWAGARERTLLT